MTTAEPYPIQEPKRKCASAAILNNTIKEYLQDLLTHTKLMNAKIRIFQPAVGSLQFALSHTTRLGIVCLTVVKPTSVIYAKKV